ncbi:MAG TPA: phytoene/squalene synthase family protein [Polyangiaceae bacterium]|nr:phytoene/squalene synthase family protein [Polyangiaceae bacterium]
MSEALQVTSGPASSAIGQASALCHATLARGSKSFALAGRLLPPGARTHAAVLYTFCRNVDDAIDLSPREHQPLALEALSRRLEAVYAGEPQHDPAFAAFAELVQKVSIPALYPRELLAGMHMDVVGTRYENLDDLLLYCHRVAGVVGLMMCHVLGIERDSALQKAAHLGIAMQLTNICRDVAEDWQLGRLYIPRSLLPQTSVDALQPRAGTPLPQAAQAPLALAVARLLRLAEQFYASADTGLAALPWRARLAIRAARHVYASIGHRIAARSYDVSRGRAVVPAHWKLWLIARSGLSSIADLSSSRGRVYQLPGRVLAFPFDVLPLEPQGRPLPGRLLESGI